MRSFKSTLLLRRCTRNSGFISQQRCLSSQFDHALVDDSENIVLVEGKASSRTAILSRPSSLNALNTSMGDRLTKLYKSWEDNPDIGFVVLKGSGRAFCAGGDIVALYHLIDEGITWHKFFVRTAWEIYPLSTIDALTCVQYGIKLSKLIVRNSL
ncbi:unnamed protein product [Ilex paraguariensis]|uniref:3-hydroxyisobutyryl-CoA hydrolase n=1 Tax=Ilex paraguariensis TaxID=185542 RepID=A0ABC8RNA7_9AQUA